LLEEALKCLEHACFLRRERRGAEKVTPINGPEGSFSKNRKGHFVPLETLLPKGHAGLSQACLYLDKNRNSPTGDIPLRFEAEFMRFSSREPEKIVSHAGYFALSLFPLLPLTINRHFRLVIMLLFYNLFSFLCRLEGLFLFFARVQGERQLPCQGAITGKHP